MRLSHLITTVAVVIMFTPALAQAARSDKPKSYRTCAEECVAKYPTNDPPDFKQGHCVVDDCFIPLCFVNQPQRPAPDCPSRPESGIQG
jgi:hypothetical protein